VTHGTSDAALRVTAIAVSAELGGTERVLLDFAARAFEGDILLRVIAPRHGPLIRILEELGVPTHVVGGPATMVHESRGGRRLLAASLALRGLRAWGKRIQGHPAVQDADVLYSVAFTAHLTTLSAAVPVVWHLHEFPPPLTAPIWKVLARRPAALIANSHAVARGWGRSVPEGRITTVPNGVDLDRFRPRQRTGWIHEQLGLPSDARLIGMPAVLARWKGQLAVLDAFAAIAHQFPTAHLVFMGGVVYGTPGERTFERDLLKAITERRADGPAHIHRLPFQPKVELVFPELDAVVHYSTRPEPFGRVVLEGMACGVPVLAAAEGGPREILTEGGWLVEPRNPDALARALAVALTLAPEALREIGEKGRVRAEDRYSARRFAREVGGVLWGVKRKTGNGKRET
jgi:glycosyltransferase involved in cell wall biosynthesis